MSKAYPYLVQHVDSEKYHLVRHRNGYDPDEHTACGHDPNNGNYNERSKTIQDAVREKKLCKVCLMSDEVYSVLAHDLRALDNIRHSAEQINSREQDTHA